MTPVYNFSAGPAMLPTAVMQQAQNELLDWQGLKMSVMEMSHRSSEYLAIAEQARACLREIMGIAENYQVLFMQGGASMQFSAVPMNLLHNQTKADYLLTGMWGKKAVAEAGRYCRVNLACDTSDSHFTTVSAPDQWHLDTDAAYVHYTPNETINGVEFQQIPDVGDGVLVADMSSSILSQPIAVDRFGLIYAGAQKNIGPAGVTVVIVREDLLGVAMDKTPAMLNYQTIANSDSMYNTPPTFAWYMAGLVFAWVKDQGGLQAMAIRNQRKSSKLYNFIDGSDFYSNPVDSKYRSRMNIPFMVGDGSQDNAFLAGAKEAGLVALKGHRLVGGMRASIYNAMPEAGVDALIAYMSAFEKEQA